MGVIQLPDPPFHAVMPYTGCGYGPYCFNCERWVSDGTNHHGTHACPIGAERHVRRLFHYPPCSFWYKQRLALATALRVMPLTGRREPMYYVRHGVVRVDVTPWLPDDNPPTCALHPCGGGPRHCPPHAAPAPPAGSCPVVVGTPMHAPRGAEPKHGLLAREPPLWQRPPAGDRHLPRSQAEAAPGRPAMMHNSPAPVAGSPGPLATRLPPTAWRFLTSLSPASGPRVNVSGRGARRSPL